MTQLPLPLLTRRQVELFHAVQLLVDSCHGAARASGWWTDLKTGFARSKPVPEGLMLIVSELGEAMEGHRKNLPDDHLPDLSMLVCELADAVIRIADSAGGWDLPLAEAVVRKLEYNSRRADHKPEARLAAGGKEY